MNRIQREQPAGRKSKLCLRESVLSQQCNRAPYTLAHPALRVWSAPRGEFLRFAPAEAAHERFLLCSRVQRHLRVQPEISAKCAELDRKRSGPPCRAPVSKEQFPQTSKPSHYLAICGAGCAQVAMPARSRGRAEQPQLR